MLNPSKNRVLEFANFFKNERRDEERGECDRVYQRLARRVARPVTFTRLSRHERASGVVEAEKRV